MPSTIEYLRAAAGPASPVGVDEKNRILRGVVLAQRGDFFTGRGSFDDQSLSSIAKLLNALSGGAKSRYGHPNPQHPGSPDELDGFLGRVKNAYPDGDKTRGDLHLDPTAFLAPPGGGTSRGDYLMARAKSDPSSFGMSLVLAADKQFRLDTHAKPKRDANGDILPPIWRPTEIHAVDVVDHGDTTPDGMLTVAERSVTGDELLRLRQSRRQKMLANEAPPTVEDLRVGWRNLQRKAVIDSLSDSAGDNTTKASGFIPANPPSHGGSATPGSFRAPVLADWTAKPWSSLTIDDRRKIAGWFAWAKSLDSFGDLHLPFRFSTGPARGRPSLSGIRAALARLNQVQGMSAAEREKVRKHLESFLPGGFRKTN